MINMTSMNTQLPQIQPAIVNGKATGLVPDTLKSEVPQADGPQFEQELDRYVASMGLAQQVPMLPLQQIPDMKSLSVDAGQAEAALPTPAKPMATEKGVMMVEKPVLNEQNMVITPVLKQPAAQANKNVIPLNTGLQNGVENSQASLPNADGVQAQVNTHVVSDLKADKMKKDFSTQKQQVQNSSSVRSIMESQNHPQQVMAPAAQAEVALIQALHADPSFKRDVLSASDSEIMPTAIRPQYQPLGGDDFIKTMDSANKEAAIQRPQVAQRPEVALKASGLEKPEDSMLLKAGELGGQTRQSIEAFGAPMAATSLAQPIHRAPVEVTGHVVPGAMSRERLTSESIGEISAGIGKLSEQKGGEIRIRLKPDNLGELHLRVSTNGNNVGIKIQASNDNAKKVLEESIQYLKEGLSAKNLSLSRVEFGSIGNHGAQAQNDFSTASQQSGSFDLMERNLRDQSSGSQKEWAQPESWEQGSMPRLTSNAGSNIRGGYYRSAAPGRIDVRA